MAEQLITLPPFSGGTASCAKCGGVDVEARYQPPGTVFVSADSGGGCTVAMTPSAPEWVARECRNCGYTWPERCLTAVEDTVDEVETLRAQRLAVLRLAKEWDEQAITEPRMYIWPATGALRKALGATVGEELR